MKKVVLIEDVDEEAAYLRDVLAQDFPQVQVMGTAARIDDGVREILLHRPDFVIMDVEIIDGTSYDILLRLKELNLTHHFDIIFMTGHERFEYATKAISYSALEFLTKPLNREKLVKAVEKAISKRPEPTEMLEQLGVFLHLIQQNTGKLQKLAVQLLKGEITYLLISDIVCLIGEKEITRFYMKDKSRVISGKHLETFEQLLIGSYNFFPVSNNTLINLQELVTYSHLKKEVTLSDGSVVVASRRGGQDLRNYIKNNPILNNRAGGG